MSSMSERFTTKLGSSTLTIRHKWRGYEHDDASLFPFSKNYYVLNVRSLAIYGVFTWALIPSPAWIMGFPHAINGGATHPILTSFFESASWRSYPHNHHRFFCERV